MNNFDDIKNKFICALAYENEKHFVREPYLLSTCSHHACKSCILDRANMEESNTLFYSPSGRGYVLKCNICENEIIAKKIQHSEEINEMIQNYLTPLFEHVKKEIEAKIEHIQSKNFLNIKLVF